MRARSFNARSWIFGLAGCSVSWVDLTSRICASCANVTSITVASFFTSTRPSWPITSIYVKAIITRGDELVFFFVEEGEVPDERSGKSIPYRGVILTQYDDQWARDEVLSEEGHQIASVLGDTKDWSKICGVVNNDNDEILVWSLRPSYGNRGANYSAYMEYFTTFRESRYRANWRTHDDFSTVFGVVAFSPSALSIPLSIRRHAFRVLKKAGFVYREEEPLLDRDARFWINRYLPGLKRNGQIAITEKWFKEAQLVGENEVVLGKDRFVRVGFRASSIVRIKSDGSCAIIFVGFSFPIVAAKGDKLEIRSGSSVYEFDPASSTLSAQQLSTP
jgi:hypothetical protein